MPVAPGGSPVTSEGLKSLDTGPATIAAVGSTISDGDMVPNEDSVTPEGRDKPVVEPVRIPVAITLNS